MSDIGVPMLYTLFVWWFGTGAVLFLDGLPRHTFKWTMLGATVLFGAGLWGLHATADNTSVGATYSAFTCGFLIWAWQEVSFYTGWVTGPRKVCCPPGCRGWKHFLHALHANLWHEVSMALSAALVVWLTWGAPNQVGTWTFMVLWWMHESARLNVLFGVRNLNAEFLPEHLAHMKGFLTQKPINLLFPISVTVSTVALVVMVMQASDPATSGHHTAGLAMLGALLGLAIIEHWFLILPLPFAELWGWYMRSRERWRTTGPTPPAAPPPSSFAGTAAPVTPGPRAAAKCQVSSVES